MGYPLRTLVLGLADLDGNDPVLTYGIDLVERFGATLHVVLAFADPFEIGTLSALPGVAEAPALADPAQVLQMKTDHLDRLRAVVSERSSTARIECHVVAATPHAALIDTVTSVSADMLLVGATRRGRLGRTLLGTTASRAIRSVTVPVLVIRDPLPRTGGRVLLATDLSELSAQTYRAGIGIAHALFGTSGLELRSLMVARQPFSFVVPIEDEDRSRAIEEKHRSFLDQLGDGGAALDPRVRQGKPAAEIVAEAEEWEADVVILGTHGRSGFKRAFLGSVAESALRNLGCNALVIPAAMFAGSEGNVEPGASM